MAHKGLKEHYKFNKRLQFGKIKLTRKIIKQASRLQFFAHIYMISFIFSRKIRLLSLLTSSAAEIRFTVNSKSAIVK